MATIVRHDRTHRTYVLVGAGFGAYQSKKPNWLLGNLMADTSEGQHAMTCVCDSNGDLYWVDSMQLTVISVDGSTPAELLQET